MLRTGVATGGLNNHVALCEAPRPLGLLNHTVGNTVLHRATGVEELALGHCEEGRLVGERETRRRKRIECAAFLLSSSAANGLVGLRHRNSQSSHSRPQALAILSQRIRGVLPGEVQRRVRKHEKICAS